MKVFYKIFKFLNADNYLVENKEFNHQLFINILSIFPLILLCTVTLNMILESGIRTVIIFNLLAVLLLGTNLIIHNNHKNDKSAFTGNFLLLIISVYFLSALGTGTIQGGNVLWCTTYPIVALLSTKRKANLFSFLFLLIILVSPVFLPFPIFTQPLALDTGRIAFSTVYIANFSIVYLMIKGIYNTGRKKDTRIYQLQDELKDKEEFISKVSYQIRTSLNNIVVVSNMLNTSELDEQKKDYFDTILASTNNLVDMVNSFSEITNVDVPERKKNQIRFDLNSTLQNTKNLFVIKEIDNKKHPIRIYSDIDYPLIGDPVKVKQIFLNLIEQILKLSRTKQIEINLYTKQSVTENSSVDILFELSTTSLQQINKEIRLRDRSQTFKTKKVIDKLGLHIAKRTIESLGGELKIEIQPEKYNFQFTLKFKKALEPEKKENTKIAPSSESKINLKNANVLLVEDNMINQKIVVLSLKNSVKNVDVANNGKEALDKFGSVKYDIILMDIQLPVMNGIVTTKKIRNIEKSTNTHTPIIAITAYALMGDKEECLAAGTDDYISKPFQIETLLEKMNNLL
ncbi:MAG: response regulator [Bacteroidales bacterium]|nr:response regulator [Bacteroidales bacterium]